MKEKEFKRIENIAEYVKDGVKNGTMPLDEVAKFARIKARKGKVNEEVITKMANGLEETKNVVKIDEKTGEAGWIVTNPDGEEYIIEDSTFKKKYEIDPENPEQYKPKGGPVHTAKIEEDIVFEAPWGGDMKIESGGSLVINAPDDIYGIQKAEFENTYASTGKDKEKVRQEVMEILEIERQKDNIIPPIPEISDDKDDDFIIDSNGEIIINNKKDIIGNIEEKREEVTKLSNQLNKLEKEKSSKEKELNARRILKETDKKVEKNIIEKKNIE